MRSTLRSTVSSTIAAVLLGAAAATALAQAAMRFDLPAQPLAESLKAVASQTSVNVLFDMRLVAGMQAPALRAEMTAEEAIRKLVEGTGLRQEMVNEHTIVLGTGSAGAKALSSGDARVSGDSGQVTLRLAQAGTDSAGAASEAAPVATAATASGERDDEPAAGTVPALDEVVVTGSRLARSAFEMPTPVTVIGSEQIQKSGFTNLADLLTQLPSVGLGLSLSTGQFSPNAGAAFVNLRGLGTARTLVLINGRRRVAGASDSAAVDLTTIPTGMVERVELITGGASAVYGADAVSGVINIILKKDFSGLELSAQAGTSQHGGAESLSATLLAGSLFAEDRGSFTFAASHVREEPLYSNERSFTDSWLSFIPNPENTGPQDGRPDFITVDHYGLAFLHPGGVFNIGGVDYTVDPNLRPLSVDPATGLPTNGDGWDFTRFWVQRMRAETTSVRGNLDFKLTDRVSLMVESEFAHGTAYSGGAPNYDFGGTLLSRDNYYIPTDLGALMDANGLTEIDVQRASTDQGIRDNDNSRDMYSILAGLQGSFGRDWKWQAFAQYGRYELRARENNQRITSRYFEAIDVIADPLTGDPVCRSEAARAAGCKPLDILGQNVATADALAYFRVNATLAVDNTQTLAGAQLTGTLLDLPAGPLATAFGVEYREDTRTYTDDPLSELGLLTDRSAGTSLRGEDSVSEAFVEVVAPLLRDRAFAKSLQLEGAVRLSNYDSIGDTTAWKLGGSWAPVQSLKVRATRSKSVRAPNLYELFAPRQISQISIYDPCEISQISSGANRAANCAALGIPEGWEGKDGAGLFYTFDTVGGGNPELDPETSKAWTAGLVVTPQSIPSLSMAVDYWKIEIDGAVQALDVTQIVDKCVDSATIENVFCPRITRAADHSISLVDYSIVNVGSLTTDGVDFQLAYGFSPEQVRLPFAGRLSVALNATYLRSLEQMIDSGDPASLIRDKGAYYDPSWRGTLSLGYANAGLRVDLDTRLIGKARIDVSSSLETYDRPRVGARVYNDLALSYDLGKSWNVRLTINNLLDVEPPMNPYTYLGGNGGLYDSLGRYFVLGATARF